MKEVKRRQKLIKEPNKKVLNLAELFQEKEQLTTGYLQIVQALRALLGCLGNLVGPENLREE